MFYLFFTITFLFAEKSYIMVQMIYYKKAGIGIAHENLAMMEEYLNWTEEEIPNIPMFACLYQIYTHFWFMEGHTWQLGELQEPLPHHDISPGN